MWCIVYIFKQKKKFSNLLAKANHYRWLHFGDNNNNKNNSLLDLNKNSLLDLNNLPAISEGYSRQAKEEKKKNWEFL